MSNLTTQNSHTKSSTDTGNRLIYFLTRKWFLVFSVIYGLFVLLPFSAPILMQNSWFGPAKIVYTGFSLLCHQLPQRSFFLFGSKSMYALSEIQTSWKDTVNPLILRQFIGSAEMGWKVAWSDRMVSMYTSILFFAWIWGLLRKKLQPLPIWGLLLLLLPMFLDGMAHFFSDFAGFGQGFRGSNLWLASLTNNLFAPSFYEGDALGSFNSWMRLVTGVLFGLGIVWFSFPYIDFIFQKAGSGQLTAKKSEVTEKAIE